MSSKVDLTSQDKCRTAGGPAQGISSARLMSGNRDIIIQHGPEEYRLRVTSAGKLILTK